MATFPYGNREISHLRSRDKRLGRAIDEIGRIGRGVTPDIFTALVASVAGQQVSAKAAETVWHRLENLLGPVTPETISAVSQEKIQQCGMSIRKAGYIKSIGDAVMNGEIDLAGLWDLPDNEVIARLTVLDGVGVWTAEMLLIFSMQRPDVVSWGDFAIRRGMIRLYGIDTLDRARFERYRRRYSPYGSVASLYLWEISHR